MLIMKTKVILTIFVFSALAALTKTSAADYFPCAAGNTWNFDVNLNLFNSMQDVGDAVWTIQKDTVIDGSTYFKCSCEMQYALGQETIDTSIDIYMLDDGTDIFMTTDPEDEASLTKIGQHSFSGTEQWEFMGNTYEASECGEYTVAAGTFESCCCVVAGETDTSGVYAPDVGPLRLMLTVQGLETHLMLKEYDVKPSTLGICCRVPAMQKAPYSPFRADNSTGTISFDLGSPADRGKLSMYTSDGRRVSQYQIGGIGTLKVDNRHTASGNILLKLDVNGKTYTGKMNVAK
jgi:hypothetical protein